MEKTIHMISGTPRSGSTLLCNILAQNPRMHATATSGVLEMLYSARNRFCELQQFQAMKEDELDKKIIQSLRGMLFGYYEDIDRPVVFDKARGWENCLEMAEAILGRKPKVICPVRDLREILASFERLWRQTGATRQLPDDKFNANNPNMYWQQRTVEGRCQALLSTAGGIVGMPVTAIKDALARGWTKDCLHFINYDDLCEQPKKSIRDLYDFLDEPQFEHDFNNVQQVTWENDLVWVYKHLHKIRSKVEPQDPTWEYVLPKTYTNSIAEDQAYFWVHKTPTIRRGRDGNGSRVQELLEKKEA